MNVTTTPSVPNAPPSWFQVAKLLGIWLFGCTGIGLVAASIDGEFGSVVLLAAGFFVGVSGAITHGILARRTVFMRRSALTKAMILWIGAMIVPTVWLANDLLSTDTPAPASYVIDFRSEGVV